MKNKIDTPLREQILIVEDDPDSLEQFRSVLVEEGYAVRTVSLASEAIVEWEREHADLLITDLFLPDMEGTALAERILEFDPNTGVIIATAYPSVESTVESIEKQVSSYLIKPVSRERLMISVEKTLERLRLRREKEELLIKLHDQILQLEETRRLKKRYLSFIVHELKRPLQAVFAAASVLNRTKRENSDEVSMLEIINRNIQTMMEMVEDVLKLEQSKMIDKISDFSEIWVRPLVETLAEDFNSALANKGLSFIVDIDPDLTVTADHEKLKLIFSNLISNAVKITVSGGIVVSGTREENEVSFTVSDSGPGMTRDEKVLVSQLLNDTAKHSARQDGTGIGLTVVRNFVLLHGGRIWFESSRKKGTVFRFTIPIQYFLVERTGAGDASIHFAGTRVTSHKMAILRLVEELLDEGRTALTVDISKSDYMTSHDISVIFNLYKLVDDRKGTLKLKNVSWQVQELMKITQLDGMVSIVSDSPKEG